MQLAADDLDLAPPRYTGGWAPWALALLAHALLLLALAWGLTWQHETTLVASAELWSALPQAAAPRTREIPAAAPVPQVPPTPPATPPKAPTTPPEAPATPPKPAAESPPANADIATHRQRDEQRRREEEQEERRLAEKRAAEQQAAAREKRARDEALRKQADKAAKEKAARAREEREQAQLEAERARHLQRILGQANASGEPSAAGDAARAAGPSASYAGLLVAHIRPNIVFTGTVSGNPRAEVEVRTLPDGTILGSRLLKSSGHRAWDEAVLRAIERTARLPRDENGRVPPTLILGFRPQEE